MLETVVEVCLTRLLNLLPDSSPFTYYVWAADTPPLSHEEISEALNKGKTNPRPYPGVPNYWSRQEHVERIAYLVAHPTEDPLSIDVGTFSSQAVLHDGHHRLAAAQYQAKDKIWISLGGDIDLAEEVFGIQIP